MAIWPIPFWTASTLVLGVSAGAVRAADLAYGEYLAQECITCHRRHVDKGAAIPVIAGRSAQYLTNALREYRTGRRVNPVMQNVARSLDPRQIEALAAYFESLEDGGEEP